MHLTEAIQTLDPENAEHWTADGAPKLSYLDGITDDKVTRKRILNLAPGLTRDACGAPTLVVADGDDEDLVEEPLTLKFEDEVVPAEAFDEDAAARVIESIAENAEPTEEELDTRLLSKPFAEVLGSHDLLKATQAVLEKRNVRAARKFSDARDELAELSKKIEWAKEGIANLERRDPSLKKSAGNPVIDYLKGQSLAREERARRIQRFHDQGVTPGAVMKSMQGSPLDMAYASKGGRGRPNPVTPKRARQEA